jgi:glycosyltransferase involved in cell wall biosynthesis
MDILFVHQNFPAQFVHVAHALNRVPGVRVGVVTDVANEHPDAFPSARYRWEPQKKPLPEPVAVNFALRASRGRMAARAMAALRDRGFNPAVVVGHLGWGETLFVKEVFPSARLVVHAEFFYSAKGADVGFDPEFPDDNSLDRRIELNAKNAAILLAMNETDIAIAPTHWQASRFPREYQAKMRVAHEGIDTKLVRPNPAARFVLKDSRLALSAADEVITFVNRNLEPYRGFHIFMRALPKILAARPRARVVIVGGEEVSYGSAPKGGRNWKENFLSEVRAELPMDRVHFVSRIPFRDFVALMQISSAHVYLTYPFVLSWSMLQAMSAGAPLIASRTAPVLEAVKDGATGVLVDFFDVEGWVRAVVDVLARPEAYLGMRDAARRSVMQSYDLARVCLPLWLELILKG